MILQSNGDKVTIKDSDVEDMVPSQASLIMPDNLLDQLTLEEISNLCESVYRNLQAIARQPTGSTKK